MPLLKKGVLIPSLGVDWSQPATFISERSGFPLNMSFHRNELVKRVGKSMYGGTISSGDQIMGISKIELNSGVKFLVRNSKTKTERLNTTTEAWIDINPTDFTGGDDDFFHYTNVTENGLLLMTNGKDPIKKWNGGSDVVSLGGIPPKCKYMTYLSPYVLVAHVDDGATNDPWKVQWCDTGQPEKWTGGNSGALLFSDEPSPIKNIKKLNNFAAVYKENSLWRLEKVANSDIFQKYNVKTGIGLASSRCLAEARGQHYFMGSNDIYTWNGGNPQSIGKNARDEIFSRLSRTKIERCFALHIENSTEIWFYIVVEGQEWPTEIWKYNYVVGYWYPDTCDEITSANLWQKTEGTTWDEEVGTWDEEIAIWDSGNSILEWEQIVFGDKNGNTQYLDYTTANDLGVPIEGLFESKDFIADSLEYDKRWLQLEVWARGTLDAHLYLDYSTDYGVTWKGVRYNSAQAYAMLTQANKKYTFYFDVSSDVIRFRFRNQELNQIYAIRNFYPSYLLQNRG